MHPNSLLLWLSAVGLAIGKLTVTDANGIISISNDRLNTTLDRATKKGIDTVYLDGQNLLGTRSGNTGQGPYLDCYCTPAGARLKSVI